MVELVENSDHPSWLLQTLLNQDNDAVEIVDPETLRFLEVNEKTCKELGYTREEMLSLRVCDIVLILGCTPCALPEEISAGVKGDFWSSGRVPRNDRTLECKAGP